MLWQVLAPPEVSAAAQEAAKPAKPKEEAQRGREKPPAEKQEQAEKLGKDGQTRLGGLVPAGQESPKELMAIAEERDSPGRLEAIRKLGDLPTPESTRTLIAICQEDPNPQVRAQSAISLGQIGDAAGIEALTDVLLNDPNLTVRISAVQGLGLTGNPSITVSLIQATAAQRDVELRVEAARALGSVHTEASYDVLLRLLNDQEPAVRKAALESLARRGDSKAAPSLVALLKDPDPEVAERASWTLGELRNKSALPTLVESLRTASSAAIRRQCALSLGRIGSPEGLDALSESALNDVEDLQVRLAAVEALAMLRSLRAGVPLSQLLRHRRPELRAASAASLARLRDPDGVSGVVSLVRDPDLGVRNTAVMAMGFWLRRFAEPLAKTAADDSQEKATRILAAAALGDAPFEELTKEPVFSNLTRLLGRSVPVDVQIAGVCLLASINTKEALSALREFASLSDLDPQVREALAKLKDRLQP